MLWFGFSKRFWYGFRKRFWYVFSIRQVSFFWKKNSYHSVIDHYDKVISTHQILVHLGEKCVCWCIYPVTKNTKNVLTVLVRLNCSLFSDALSQWCEQNQKNEFNVLWLTGYCCSTLIIVDIVVPRKDNFFIWLFFGIILIILIYWHCQYFLLIFHIILIFYLYLWRYPYTKMKTNHPIVQ